MILLIKLNFHRGKLKRKARSLNLSQEIDPKEGPQLNRNLRVYSITKENCQYYFQTRAPLLRI